MLRGQVEKVNQYAEPTGWRQANVKEYKAFVAIDAPPIDLRSGMTAAVTIKCAEVPNALQVPVQSVYAHGNKMYCFVYESDGTWDARPIKPGPTNDKYFVIESGLEAGDRVAMNPRGYLADVNLPKLSPEEAQRAVPQPARGARGDQTADGKGGGGKAEGGGSESGAPSAEGEEPATDGRTTADSKAETDPSPQPPAPAAQPAAQGAAQ
jgi:hypothetical protein